LKKCIYAWIISTFAAVMNQFINSVTDLFGELVQLPSLVK
jgi:hypothetical protein